MNFSKLNQARELKARFDKIQKELDEMVIEADAGRGAVKVTMNGQMRLKSVKIAPEAINSEKSKNLEELVLKAVNDAIEKTRKMATRQLKELTGGIKLPGLF